MLKLVEVSREVTDPGGIWACGCADAHAQYSALPVLDASPSSSPIGSIVTGSKAISTMAPPEQMTSMITPLGATAGMTPLAISDVATNGSNIIQTTIKRIVCLSWRPMIFNYTNSGTAAMTATGS